MCEIHLIKKLDNRTLNKNDFQEFTKLMCFGSKHNNDAWGLFNKDYHYKQSGKFNPMHLDVTKATIGDFIVGHNRLATSGFGEGSWDGLDSDVKEKKDWADRIIEWYIPPWILNSKKKKDFSPVDRDITYNHHPFELDDFILVHNGVIHNADNIRSKFKIESHIKTDSYVILWLINTFFKMNKTKSARLIKIRDAITRTCKLLEGNYSIFLYDKVGNSLIYFKNNWTSFEFKIYGDILVGSTEEDNLDYVYFGHKRKALDIDTDTIYLIGNKDKPLIKLGKINERREKK